MSGLDEIIFRFFFGLSSQAPFWDACIVFGAQYLPWLVGSGLVIFLVLNLNHSVIVRRALVTILALVVAFIIGQIIKLYWPSARPALILADVRPLLTVTEVNSFPSGHALFFFTLGSMITYYQKNWGTILILAAIIISICRVIAGIHWPSDIFGGMILGAIVSSVIYNLFESLERKRF